MKTNTFELISVDRPRSAFLSQAHDLVSMRRFDHAERLLANAVETPGIIILPDLRVHAHCSILLASVREERGAYRCVEPLYHGAVFIYDRELGFEHPVVQELASYMYQHFYF